MMRYELADILFFIKSLKNPTANFNITDFVIFSCSSTRSSTHNKLQHVRQFNNRDRHFYFCRLPRLWNSLPPLNIESSVASLKRQLKSIFYNHFLENFDSSNPCTYHYSCPCCKCMHTPVADPGWGIWGKCPPPSRNCIQDRDTLIEQSITLIKQSQCS